MSGETLVTATAHGKINIHLGVGPKREDGYHELATVFQSISASDTLSLVRGEGTVSEGSPVVGMEVSQSVPGEVPTDSSNLAWRAVDAVVEHYRGEHGSITLPELTISLFKGIPVAGGMAGGSADAAAALVATDHWLAGEYGLEPLGKRGLHDLAAGLGADVPFVLMGGTALGRGRGDELIPMMSRGTYHWAVITSNEGLSTPSVFAKLDELREQRDDLEPHMWTERVSEALSSGNYSLLTGCLRNDLQPAALSLRPELRTVLQVGFSQAGNSGIVSGSGPTCVFLCRDEEWARMIAAAVPAEVPGTSGMVVSGPAGGAAVVD